MHTPKLILASNSPRRRQLIAAFGWEFRVLPADIDETPLPDEPPPDYVARLALAKGRALLSQAAEDEIIVAADTSVADGTEILGKPLNSTDAWRMLRQLCGRTHQVHTAVAVLRRSDQLAVVDVCTTDVPMRTYTPQEMAAYISSQDPFDKAGAYAIQHRGFHPVESLAGCYANVVGLPLCHLTRLLRRAGVDFHGGLPAYCQAQFDYACPVSETILAHRLGPDHLGASLEN